ncbi:MAG TPA: 3-deoxy-7-phosphoheptulonate synthase [Clostridiales bacterium]|nr:3-deoxy-7-phosphoheptulonate synthase [Clostridiales bacterium]
MIIVMKPNAGKRDIENIVEKLHEHGLEAHLSTGKQVTIIGVIGDKGLLSDSNMELMPGVDKLVPITESYKLVNKKFNAKRTVVNINGIEIGGDHFTLIAGPCAVESEEQIFQTASKLKESGVKILRGGAFKPRTSPYSFQGMGVEGLRYMRNAADANGMIMVSEVTSLATLQEAVPYLDIIQIGARNMQNFELLKEVGKTNKPVFLKRGLSSTIDEWLNAAEYIIREHNNQVMLCERGIRTFETATRNTLDISAIPVLKSKTHLPVFIDPSHASGVKDYIIPLARAAAAVDCDGLMIEVHPNPDKALSDGAQSLTPDEFKELVRQIKPIVEIMGRKL